MILGLVSTETEEDVIIELVSLIWQKITYFYNHSETVRILSRVVIIFIAQVKFVDDNG